MGYHIREVTFVATDGSQSIVLPVIAKDGGTGAWRDAKKAVRTAFLNKAKELRAIGEKEYFAS